MNIFLLAFLLLNFCVMPENVNAAIRQSTASDQLCQIRNIYITEFDQSVAAMNFRQRLGKQVSKKFVIVGKPNEADAILTGEFSSQSNDDYSFLTFKHDELKNANGEVVWHGDFDLKFSNSLWGLGSGHVEKAARRIAKDMLKKCK